MTAGSVEMRQGPTVQSSTMPFPAFVASTPAMDLLSITAVRAEGPIFTSATYQASEGTVGVMTGWVVIAVSFQVMVRLLGYCSTRAQAEET